MMMMTMHGRMLLMVRAVFYCKFIYKEKRDGISRLKIEIWCFGEHVVFT